MRYVASVSFGKDIGETKKLGAVYQVAERTLAKIDEVLK
jgi:hypothetical protein